MKNWQEVIKHSRFRYIDHTNLSTFHTHPYSALSSFAIDDALATSVSHGDSSPTMRAWIHPKTIVLGIPDTRVPFLSEGVQFLSKQNYNVIVRNSGGLAVPLDSGVINLSLVLPDVKHLSIHDCYEAMVSFIQYMLSDLTTDIKAFEIVGSYCPGDYDLSIGNKKFAGISQRRIRDGAAIQIYLDVEGNTKERAALIRDFYKISIKQEETRFTYPSVEPKKMASLSELLSIDLSVNDIKKRILSMLNQLNEEVIVSEEFSNQELEVFEKRYKQMVKRNETIAELQ